MKHFILSVFLVLALTGCSGEERKINKAATDYGKADAQTLIESASSMTPLELEGYILGIRATEYDYIENGHKKAAELYIKGFEDYIRENSDSLANVMFK